MVRSIKLQNFRSHKKTKIYLNKGITGIIGISQSGKTNIIRGLKLLAFNKPSGKRYIYRRKKNINATVEVELNNGTIVSTTRGKENNYSINGEKYRKFGRSVPKEVQDVLNLSTINFQEQLDSPFLITSKPSEISKTINSMTGMNDVDDWIDEINKRTKEVSQELKTYEFKASEAEAILEQCENLPKAEKFLSRAKKIKKKIQKKENIFLRIEDNIEEYEMLNFGIKKNKKILDAEPIIDEAEKVQKQLEEIRLKLEIIDRYLGDFKSLTIETKKNQKLIQDYINLIKLKGYCPVCHEKIDKNAIKRIKNEVSPSK